MKLGVVITTYQKPDGTTPILLKRALDSIKNQSYQDYILVVIGDKYEDNSELESICNLFNFGDKLVLKNLPYAKERDKYPMGSKELWSAGGVNARNTGIDICQELGINYICHLDHDDYWHPQHLEIINHSLNLTQDAVIINTCSTYFNSHLPGIKLTNEITPSTIKPGALIHSSACIDFNKIPFRYRDVFEETGKEFAADADFWGRVGKYIIELNLKTYKISTLTCYHPTEGDTLKQKKIII